MHKMHGNCGLQKMLRNPNPKIVALSRKTTNIKEVKELLSEMDEKDHTDGSDNGIAGMIIISLSYITILTSFINFRTQIKTSQTVCTCMHCHFWCMVFEMES